MRLFITLLLSLTMITPAVSGVHKSKLAKSKSSIAVMVTSAVKVVKVEKVTSINKFKKHKKYRGTKVPTS